MSSNNEPIKLTISGLIEDLRNGITRCEGDVNYSKERGSIQEKYGLTKAEVKDIFKNPKLAGIKVRNVQNPRYILTDDTEDKNITVKETNFETKEDKQVFGIPSKTAENRLEKQETSKVEQGESKTDEVAF